MIERLYRDLHQDVLRFFLRRAGNRDVAEDLTQETFIKAFRNVQHNTSIVNPAGYLYRTATTILIDYYRTRRVWEELPELEADSYENDDTARAEIAGWLERFIRDLPEPYRTTLLLSDIEGVPYREIAERMGVTVASVKTRVHRGRKLLHRELTECCRFSFDVRGRVVDYLPLKREQSCCEDAALN
ncbi:MAG: sigma-70 family RNA polymerase sigma factor [Alkalispirochaeta sp.]